MMKYNFKYLMQMILKMELLNNYFKICYNNKKKENGFKI